MEKCKICSREFKNVGSLSRHLSQKHNIKYYDYMINYLNIIHPLCIVCNEKKVRYHKTRFSEYCSFECSVIANSNNELINQKRSTTLKEFNKNNPSIRENVGKRLKELYAGDSELKQRVSDSLKKAWEKRNKEERKFWVRGLNKQETIEKRNITIRNIYSNNDKLKERISNSVKIAYKNMDDAIKEIIFNSVNNQEVYKKRANTLKKKWENLTYEEKGKLLDSMKCGYVSKDEEELNNFIKNELNIDTIQSYRKLGTELDIFIPQQNIAIEYNGLFWHSELNGKNRNYHLEKTKICEQNNIQLIHIFEDEWKNKKDIVKSKLSYLLNKSINNEKIYARKCNIKEIKKESIDFLNKNHIQGSDNSTIRLGLYYGSELLVAVMTFNTARAIYYNKQKQNNVYELVRYATDINYNVIGGAGKLLKYFTKKYNPSEIYSYADKRYTNRNNNLYLNLGFSFKSESKPNYFYIEKYRKRLHRFNFTKYKLIKMGNDANLTEWEIMQQLGYDRIWDCGAFKYVKNLDM